jgi:quinolinate synthase
MTESGVNYSLERAAPGRRFHYVANENCNCSECPFMRLNTLEKLRDALTNLAPRVELAPDLMRRALVPLERMLAVG